MKTTQAHKSPPGASGVHDTAPSHGLASPSIRPNTRRADSDPVAAGVAALLVACTLVELSLFGWVVSGMVAR
jgi:hypothetical protein